MTLVASVLKLQPSQAILEDEDEKKYYWDVVLQYWKLPAIFKHFPGPNPVSLERNDFDRLKNEDFLAALKTDGVRYLLVLTTKPNSTEPISLMIDRALNMYEIEIWANEEYFYNGCLLDGELVWSTSEELQFIIFDVVIFKGIFKYPIKQIPISELCSLTFFEILIIFSRLIPFLILSIFAN